MLSSMALFFQEMRARKADFEYIAFGGAQHGFTMHKGQKVDLPGVGYSESADRRSAAAMLTLFNELYGVPKLGDLRKYP